MAPRVSFQTKLTASHSRRIFFKLKKIILIAPEGQVVTPDVSNDPISNPQGQSPPAAPDTSDTHDQKNKLNPVGSKSTSASISSPNMPDVEDSEALADADHEAADSIEVRLLYPFVTLGSAC